MISAADWQRYVDRLAAIDERAARAMREFIRINGIQNTQALIEYAYAIATKYGEASAALAAEMYDAIAETAPQIIALAEVASTATIEEVAETVNGILETSVNENSIAGGVSRLVKRAGADTIIQNAVRDRAEFAWIPGGDGCAFCLMLASNGWQPASKKSLTKGHAAHIHSNCKCTYAVRFRQSDDIPGYHPERYKKEFADIKLEPGQSPTWKNKINALRRENYEENRDKIREQQDRAAALRRQAKENAEV